VNSAQSRQKNCATFVGELSTAEFIDEAGLKSALAGGQKSGGSPAAVFRAIEAWAPTLLIDEADSFVRNNEELRGILNSGHTRDSAFVIRTVGDDHEPRRFSTWAAKVVCLIGKLPDTLADRSIEIPLKRKLPSESVEKLRHADPEL
jgi:putative DNA primase/helicase